MYNIKSIFDLDFIELENFIKDKISNLNHIIIILKSFKKNNLSFALLNENKIKAICPFHYEIDYSNKKKRKQGTLFGISLPGLIVSDEIDSKEMRSIVLETLNEIDRLSLKHSLSKVEICFSDFINFDLKSEKFKILYRLLMEYKYLDISLIGNRIDLSRDLDVTLQSMSKGHKAIIKKNKYNFIFYNFENKKLDFKIFCRLAEGLTDHKTYAPFFYEIYKKNLFDIVEVFDKDKKIAYAGFCKINNIVEYFISKVIDKRINTHHTMIYEAIKKYKSEGYKFLHLGVVSYGPSLHYIPSKKALNISIFKRGFKGTNYPLTIFEKYFSKEHFKNDQSLRIKNFSNIINK